MVINLMPIGLLAIILAALLSALTSALSAILNSTSTLFTMDFYCHFDKKADSKKLVKVGKIASLVIIIIAAVWAPQIGKFGSLLKYYQEMLSYISPPIVAAFLLGIFSKRVNANGAFTGLVSGLAIAILMLFFRQEIFGDMHFLLVVPFLLGISILIMYSLSYLSPAPAYEKLADTTFRRQDLVAEFKDLRGHAWYKSYLGWAILLLLLSALIWIVFS